MRFLLKPNPSISILLIPWFIPRDRNRFEIAAKLYNRLLEEPDKTFCWLAIENDKCHGFIAGYIEDGSCIIWQARARADFPYSRIAFNGLISWAKSKRCKKLRAGVPDERLRRFFRRRYGFIDDVKKGELIKDVN